MLLIDMKFGYLSKLNTDLTAYSMNFRLFFEFYWRFFFSSRTGSVNQATFFSSSMCASLEQIVFGDQNRF